MSHERPPSRLDKALPPFPRPERPEQLQENTTARPSRDPFLSAPESNAPLIPQKNSRRFSCVGSDVSPASSSPLRPPTRTSSTFQNSISNSNARPTASLPPSDWRKNPSAPPPLKLKHAISSPYQTNKIAQLTGCDLSADFSPIHYQRPRFESEASICRSLYIDDVSPTTIISRERTHSEDSLSSIVDSYSDWGSWAPSSPLTSPLLPPTPGLKMDSGVAQPEDVGSTSTITAESNTRTPVPPPVPPPRNRTGDFGPPSDEVVWRTSCLRSPKRATTLEELIEHERTQLENGYIGEPPLSPLAHIAALQLKRDSGFGSSVDDRIGRSAVRSQASLSMMPNSYHLHHVRSVSRFSDSGSDDDNASVHSVTSLRIRNGAKSVRDSFVRGLSGLSRPTSNREDSNTRSRLSNLSYRDTARASQRTSDTSATTLSPAATNNSHKHRYTLSSSTTRSNAISFERVTSATNMDAQKPNTRYSGFSRSWTAAFRKPFRNSHSTQRSESGLERRKSKKHSRMVSAPAKFNEDVRKVTLQIVLLPKQARAPHGIVDLSEARRHKVALLPEEIVAAAKLAAEYANIQEDEESLSPAEQATAVTLRRRFSITGRDGKVLGTKDTTTLPPPPLPMSHQANLGVPLLHVPALEDRKEAERRTEEGTMKGRFSVRAMMGREFVSLKAKAGIKSREERRREQLKSLIRVVEVEDEKLKTAPKKPSMPLREAPQAPEKIKKELTERAEVRPGLAIEEMSSAAQMWL